MDELDEREAIARLKRGDKSGLAYLFRQYALEAVNAASLITQDRQLAEAIVQDAFIRVFKRIHQFDDSRPFAPWFFRIIANDAKKAVTRGPWLEPLPPYHNDEDQVASQWLDGESDPADMVEIGEFKQMVRDALAKLSPDYRAAIVMRYYLDMSEAEMAEEAGVPPGTIKSRLNMARRHLKRLLPPARFVKHRAPEGEQ